MNYSMFLSFSGWGPVIAAYFGTLSGTLAFVPEVRDFQTEQRGKKKVASQAPDASEVAANPDKPEAHQSAQPTTL